MKNWKFEFVNQWTEEFEKDNWSFDLFSAWNSYNTVRAFTIFNFTFWWERK